MLHSSQRTESLDGLRYKENTVLLDSFRKYVEPSSKTFDRVKYALKKIADRDTRILAHEILSRLKEYMNNQDEEKNLLQDTYILLQRDISKKEFYEKLIRFINRLSKEKPNRKDEAILQEIDFLLQNNAKKEEFYIPLVELTNNICKQSLGKRLLDPYTENLLRKIYWSNHYFLAILVELSRKYRDYELKRDRNIEEKLYLLHDMTLGVNNGYFIDPEEHSSLLDHILSNTELSIHGYLIAEFRPDEIKKMYEIQNGFRKNNILVAEEILDKIMINFIIKAAIHQPEVLELDYIEYYQKIKDLGQRALMIENLYKVTREFLSQNHIQTKDI